MFGIRWQQPPNERTNCCESFDSQTQVREVKSRVQLSFGDHPSLGTGHPTRFTLWSNNADAPGFIIHESYDPASGKNFDVCLIKDRDKTYFNSFFSCIDFEILNKNPFKDRPRYFR